MEEIEEINL